MPIDLRKVMEEQEARTSKLASDFPSREAEFLSSLVPEIESRRASELRSLGTAEAGERTSRILGRRLSGLAGTRTAGVGRSALGLSATEKFRIADRIRREKVAADLAARQAMFDEIANRQAMADLQRELMRSGQQETIAEEFSQRGLEQASRYAADQDYSAALIRAITGTVGSLGTAYLLSGLGKGEKFEPVNYAPYSQPGISTLRGQTAFSSYLDPFSLRRAYGIPKEGIYHGR